MFGFFFSHYSSCPLPSFHLWEDMNFGWLLQDQWERQTVNVMFWATSEASVHFDKKKIELLCMLIYIFILDHCEPNHSYTSSLCSAQSQCHATAGTKRSLKLWVLCLHKNELGLLVPSGFNLCLKDLTSLMSRAGVQEEAQWICNSLINGFLISSRQLCIHIAPRIMHTLSVVSQQYIQRAFIIS